MFSKKLVILCFVFEVICWITALVKLPEVKDNCILTTDSAIRNTTNKLFSLLNLKTKEESRLKQYSLVHNFLTSVSLQDYTNLKEIAKLTRVDKEKINNDTTNYMTTLNEILNGDIKNEVTESNDSDVLKYIDIFLNILDNYKNKYSINDGNLGINAEILKYFSENDNVSNSYDYSFNENQIYSESVENATIDDESEFWEPSGRRIYRGTRTKIKHFPFIASIQIFDQFQCAGSIIKSDLIITAASCLQLAWNNRFFRENPAFLSVRVGSTYSNGGGENIPVMEIYFHPEYDPKNLRNNICLLRLLRKLKFRRRSRSVKKINFDRHPSSLPLTTDGITILGWGARDTGNIIADPRLSFAVLDVYPLNECQDIYSREYVTQKHFCAGFVSKGGGACNRDVGGPGVVRGILMGVVSFGSPVCGTPDAPTVFTKLGYYTDWIEEIMEQDVPHIRIRTTLKPVRSTNVPVFLKHNPTTTFKIPPITGKIIPKPITELEGLRILRGDTKLFQEFLATMFNSKEARDYQELFKDAKETAVRQDKKVSKIQTVYPDYEPDSVTEIGIVEPDYNTPSNEPVTIIEETFAVVDNDNLEQEIEKDIVKLIDNINLDDIIKIYSQENGSTAVHNKQITEILKENKARGKIKDADNSILTLLYLSDSEKKDDEKFDSNGSFKDLTYRNNLTNVIEDVIPRSVLYNWLSEAVNNKPSNNKK